MDIDCQNGADFKQIPHIYASTAPNSFPIPINKGFIVFLLATCFHSFFSRLFGSEDVGTCSPETSIDFQRTTRRYIPEDRVFLTTAARTSDSTYTLLSVLFSAEFCTTLQGKIKQ
jgi:hypothetical protein